uniref:Regulator of cell cycle n=1 Tax=Ficedula albicollis TaxID=59894 RepID=A0A803VGF1_FICAL
TVRCRLLGTPLAAAPGPSMAEELSELLREFHEVMEDFERGPASQYQQHLQELKRRAGQSVYDSGIDELESDLNSSEEHLNTPADTFPSKGKLRETVFFPKAKLGDTQELEEFIADLDKALEEM